MPRRTCAQPDPNDPNDPDDSPPPDGHDDCDCGPPRRPPRGRVERGDERERDHTRSDARRSSSLFTNSPAPVVDQRIQKLSAKTIGTFDPDKDSVNQFCQSLLTYVEMYGEMSVIAAIPTALEGWAKKWFRSHNMPRDRMRAIDG